MANDLSACHRHLLRSDVASANLEMLRHISSSRVCSKRGEGSERPSSAIATTREGGEKMPQREAVYLHYYEGLGTRAIASLLETTDDAVRQRLSRARVSLRKTLKGGFDDFSA